MGVAQGYYLRALKLKNVERELAEEHYVDLKSKPFYPGLVEYIVRRVSLQLDCTQCQPARIRWMLYVLRICRAVYVVATRASRATQQHTQC